MLLLLAALLTQQPDSAALARAERYFADTDGQALLVMHRGAIVFERYRAGGASGTRQLLASGSKSFVGVAALAAVADGLLTLDSPVSAYLPAWKNDDRKSRITVRQLLSLASGLESGNPGTGCGGPRATWQDAVDAGTFAEPGSAFRYGPFPFIVAGSVIERRQPKPFDQYLTSRVLDPLGVHVEWRLTCGGDRKPQLAGGAAMTARDWATFGEFIRNGGTHRGRRILPEALVRQLFVPSVANPAYGLSWWLAGATVQAQPAAGLEVAGADSGRAERRRRIGAILRERRAGGSRAQARREPPGALPAWMPRDVVMAAGAGKQRLYVIPSRELVIVRMGPVRGGREFADVEFLGAVFGATRSD